MADAQLNCTTCIYKLTRFFPKDEMYGLTSQMRRASVSIASNIAEGRGRINPCESSASFLGSHRDRPSNSRLNCWWPRRSRWEQEKTLERSRVSLLRRFPKCSDRSSKKLHPANEKS